VLKVDSHFDKVADDILKQCHLSVLDGLRWDGRDPGLDCT
jgi:hypothetical protein